MGCRLSILIRDNLGPIPAQACTQGFLLSFLHPVGFEGSLPGLFHITMGITMGITHHHPLVPLGCFLEGPDAIREHHHYLVALPQDTTMSITRSTKSITSIMRMEAIMGIIMAKR